MTIRETNAGWYVVSPSGNALAGPFETEAKGKHAAQIGSIPDDIKVSVKFGEVHGYRFKAVEKMAENESLVEKVHTLPGHRVKRGAPTGPDRARAFDKVNPKTGARPTRSFMKNYNPEKGKYHAIEFSDEEDFIMVLVMGDGKEFSYGKSVPYGKDHEKDPWTEYYGVNVLFFPDGKIDASTNDPTSAKQWRKDKDKIIKVAKDSLKDEDLPGIYDGLGGKSVKRGTGKLSFDPHAKSDYHGYHDPKTNESLLVEDGKTIKIKTLNINNYEVVIRLWKHKSHSYVGAYLEQNGEPVMSNNRPMSVEIEDAGHDFDAIVSCVAALKSVNTKQFPGSMREIFRKAVKTNESRLSFKAFLLKEMKVKEPGWYVVDHVDKPIEGPMQEGGAKRRAKELNDAHAKKHGKGEITPYSAEYYTDYEITRMNEGKLSQDDDHFGFIHSDNAKKAAEAIKAAGIKFTRDTNFGVHYMYFTSKSDVKKAAKIARGVIDVSVEDEW